MVRPLRRKRLAPTPAALQITSQAEGHLVHGVKSISPTQFEVRKKNFYQADELRTLFLKLNHQISKMPIHPKANDVNIQIGLAFGVKDRAAIEILEFLPAKIRMKIFRL
jgi:hypothetical protein